MVLAYPYPGKVGRPSNCSSLTEKPLAQSNRGSQAFLERLKVKKFPEEVMSDLTLYEALSFRYPLWTARIIETLPGLGIQPLKALGGSSNKWCVTGRL